MKQRLTLDDVRLGGSIMFPSDLTDEEALAFVRVLTDIVERAGTGEVMDKVNIIVGINGVQVNLPAARETLYQVFKIIEQTFNFIIQERSKRVNPGLLATAPVSGAMH